MSWCSWNNIWLRNCSGKFFQEKPRDTHTNGLEVHRASTCGGSEPCCHIGWRWNKTRTRLLCWTRIRNIEFVLEGWVTKSDLLIQRQKIHSSDHQSMWARFRNRLRCDCRKRRIIYCRLCHQSRLTRNYFHLQKHYATETVKTASIWCRCTNCRWGNSRSS